MKKIILTLLVSICFASANAQDAGYYGNKFFDNWFVGAQGGVATGTTNQALMKHLNPLAGLRAGKYFSPVFGFGVEANAFFNLKHGDLGGDQCLSDTKSFITNYNAGVIALFNLTNAIWGYNGEARNFDITFVPGILWGHTNGNSTYLNRDLTNVLINKLALDFGYNFGKMKEWQVYVEPSLNYLIAGAKVGQQNISQYVRYDINASYLQLTAGVQYRFKNSNGTHNFTLVAECDPFEMDQLNNTVNQLRQENTDAKKQLEELKKELNECNMANEEMERQKNSMKETPLPPYVFFQCNKADITPAQMQSVKIAADILKKHPEYNIALRGYASPEGPAGNNTSLGIRRANAVKDALVNNYGIAADRITAVGCGSTDKLFNVYECNRVTMMTLELKDAVVK